MSITDENEAITVCQATQHAMLIPWGRFSRLLGLSERLRAAVVLRRHKDAAPGGDLILEFGLASLAGYEYLQDLNLGPHPLAGEQAVQDVWDIEFRHSQRVLNPTPRSAAFCMRWMRRWSSECKLSWTSSCSHTFAAQCTKCFATRSI